MQICAACGHGFQPRRADMQYCGPACRQAAYRARTKIRGEHQETGWPHKPSEYGYPGPWRCTWITSEGKRCQTTATWRIEQQRSTGAHPGPWTVSYWCEEHLPQHLERYEVAGVAATHASMHRR